MGIGNLLPGFRGRVKEVAQAMPSVETLGRGVPAAGIPPTRRQSIGNEEFRYTSATVAPPALGRGVYLLALPPDFLSPPPALGAWGGSPGTGPPGELASRGFGSSHHRRARALPPLHQSTGAQGFRYASATVAPLALGAWEVKR